MASKIFRISGVDVKPKKALQVSQRPGSRSGYRHLP